MDGVQTKKMKEAERHYLLGYVLGSQARDQV